MTSERISPYRPGSRAAHAQSMTQIADRPAADARAGAAGAAARRRPRHPSLGPNWFAAVMGTGIVATAGAALPVHLPGLRVFATVIWALAAAVLIVLTAACATGWTRHPQPDPAVLSDPVMAQFWGAPAMALMTVGAGTLLLGRGLLGPAGGRRRLGAVERRHGARPGHLVLDPVPDDDPPRHRPGRGVRRLADARRAAHGVGGDRRPADPVRRAGRPG